MDEETQERSELDRARSHPLMKVAERLADRFRDPLGYKDKLFINIEKTRENRWRAQSEACRGQFYGDDPGQALEGLCNELLSSLEERSIKDERAIKVGSRVLEEFASAEAARWVK